jgi:hypothetical protein
VLFNGRLDIDLKRDKILVASALLPVLGLLLALYLYFPSADKVVAESHAEKALAERCAQKNGVFLRPRGGPRLCISRNALIPLD